jgi:hypothetical protein
MVLAISHTLGAHEALGRPYTLPGFLEVVHRLFENGVFVGHDRSIRTGIIRSLDCFAHSRKRALLRREADKEVSSSASTTVRTPYMFRDAMLKLLLAETLPYAKLIADS